VFVQRFLGFSFSFSPSVSLSSFSFSPSVSLSSLI